MDNRKKVAQYSLISTIMQGIMLVFIVSVLVMAIVLIFYLGGFIGDSAGLTQNVNPDDVTAGWVVLFGAAGSVIGVLAGIILIVLSVILIGPLIAGIVVLIYGIHTYKRRESIDFARRVKNDSIIKLVINAVIIILSLFTMPSSGSVKSFIAQLDEMAMILVFDIPAIVTVILSIMALRKVKDIEVLPQESKQQYIEYNEDNSSYFGE